MPQPKKQGSSARKPAARKPAARKPAAAKGTAAKRSAPSKAGGARKPRAAAAGTPTSEDARAAQKREDQLLAAVASARDLLTRGIVITTERVQETVDDAVKHGKMTRQDAEELAANLVGIGRRQTQDALAELEALVGRSASQTRRFSRAGVKNVGSVARRAPGSDRALRTVDRVRRAARLGPSFPISGYDDLTTVQIKERLGDLSSPELRKVRDHERRNANRKSILGAIERQLGQ